MRTCNFHVRGSPAVPDPTQLGVAMQELLAFSGKKDTENPHLFFDTCFHYSGPPPQTPDQPPPKTVRKNPSFHITHPQTLPRTATVGSVLVSRAKWDSPPSATLTGAFFARVNASFKTSSTHTLLNIAVPCTSASVRIQCHCPPAHPINSVPRVSRLKCHPPPCPHHPTPNFLCVSYLARLVKVQHSLYMNRFNFLLDDTSFLLSDRSVRAIRCF